MHPLDWVHDDGGRAAAGFKGDAGDCVVRAIAIAEGQVDLFETPAEVYRRVYTELRDQNAEYAATHRGRVAKSIKKSGSTPRNGVHREVFRPWLLSRGWVWTPTMAVGQGTTVHLRKGEIPERGPLIVSLSRHVAAVIDGVVHDNHDPSRDGTRAVYGYFSRA